MDKKTVWVLWSANKPIGVYETKAEAQAAKRKLKPAPPVLITETLDDFRDGPEWK